MNTRKFTGDMSSQVEADRDELVSLREEYTKLQRLVSSQGIEIMGLLEREKEARWLIESNPYSPHTKHKERRDQWLKGQP